MGSETNIHRAARKLQRESNMTYAQAHQAVLAARSTRTGPAAAALPAPFKRATALRVGQRVPLTDASIDGVGVVVELAVGANPNLVRFDRAGTPVVLDVRRFTPTSLDPVTDDVAAALIFDGRTTGAGDVQMLLGLSVEVTVERVGDAWVLYACSDPDVVNTATFDGRVSTSQLITTLVAAGVVRVLEAAGGDVTCVLVDTNRAAPLCELCRVFDHDVCGADRSCPCCVDTMVNTTR